MSYDIYLRIDAGGLEPTIVAEVGNYTSNCSPMWAAALGQPLADMDNGIAGEAVEALEHAVEDMRNPARKGFYEAMNPSNGWGDYVSAAGYLETLLIACKAHPKAYICISR